jgi:HAD superfamily hydrolase (TIGR01548 family)
MKGVLIFDMDGVLVDVADSYRETIIRTIQHFTGRLVTRDFIQELKNRGGFNDDWGLCHKVSRDFGFRPQYQEVVDYFQSLFLGENNDGLILREKWTARDGLLERLSEKWRLSVFTGRTREEARLTLDRFAPRVIFDPIIGNKDVENLKPAPDGILKICAGFPGAEAVYVGDNVDDARSARAAGVAFIGVAAAGNPRGAELAELFRREGARAVVEDINELEPVLA